MSWVPFSYHSLTCFSYISSFIDPSFSKASSYLCIWQQGPNTEIHLGTMQLQEINIYHKMWKWKKRICSICLGSTSKHRRWEEHFSIWRWTHHFSVLRQIPYINLFKDYYENPPGLPWWPRWWSYPPAIWETLVWSLGWEDPLEVGMATHSSILAWRIPWTEEPGGL